MPVEAGKQPGSPLIAPNSLEMHQGFVYDVSQ